MGKEIVLLKDHPDLLAQPQLVELRIVDLLALPAVIEPAWMSFKPLMQRIKVDFPYPDGPIMQMTSPFITSKETPFSTSSAAKGFMNVLQRDDGLIRGPR